MGEKMTAKAVDKSKGCWEERSRHVRVVGAAKSASGGYVYMPSKSMVFSRSTWRSTLEDEEFPGSGEHNFDFEVPEPGAQLKMFRVEGYRGWDCRDNVKCLQDGEIVFPSGALCVVMPISSERAARFYRSHDDDVVSLSVHSDQRTVVSGQVQVPFVLTGSISPLHDNRSAENRSCLCGTPSHYKPLLKLKPGTSERSVLCNSQNLATF